MIKAIAFDFDDTIYIGDVWNNFIPYVRNFLVKSLNLEKVDDILKSHCHGNRVFTFELAVSLEKEGYDLTKFFDLVANNVYEHTSDDVKVLPNEFLEKLSKKYSLYITTYSNQKYLKHYMEKYAIKNCFKEMLSVDLFSKERSKEPLYEHIIEKESIKPNELLVIGDNLEKDIKTAEKIGAKGFLFRSTSFDEIYDYFTQNGILDCEEFKTKG